MRFLRDWLSNSRSAQLLSGRLSGLRKEAFAEIERLIEFLDASDPYTSTQIEPDDEADDAEDEPSLGSLDHMTNQTRWAEGGCTDAEDEHDGAEPDECGEPSLGAFDQMANQEHSWSTKLMAGL